MRRLQSNTFFSLRCYFFDLSDIDISDCGSGSRLVHCPLLSGCLWNERSVQSAQCCWTRWSSSDPPCVCPCSMIVLQFTAVLSSSPSHSSATYLTRWLICFLFSFSSFLPFFSLILASYCKGTFLIFFFFPSQENLDCPLSMSFHHSPSLSFVPHTYSTQSTSIYRDDKICTLENWLCVRTSDGNPTQCQNCLLYKCNVNEIKCLLPWSA